MRQLRNFRFVLIAAAVAAGAATIPARADLTFLNAWGTSGTGNGQFNDPLGIAVAPSGTVYVADNQNNRVEIFNSTGSVFQAAFGSFGAGNGQFKGPAQIAIAPSGTVAVSDFSNNRVQLFGPNGAFQSILGTAGTGNGQFSGPDGIAFNSSGTLYVTDALNNRVQTFNSAGTFQSTFGSAGNGTGQFQTPIGVAVDLLGTAYVTDFSNNRVEIFSSTGGFLSTFGAVGSGNGQLNLPNGIAVSSTALVYVVDESNNRVQIFNSSGVFQSAFGAAGTGNGQFNHPGCVAVAPSGMVYVTDQSNQRVERLFDPNSWTSGTNSFTDPTTGPTSLSTGAGQILGQNFTLTSAMGLNLAGNLVINSNSTFTQAGGPLTAATLTMSGRYNYQAGATSFTTLSLNAGGILTATQGGTLNFSSTTAVTGLMTLDGGTSFVSPSGLTILSGGIVTINNATLLPSSVAIAGGQLLLNNSASSIINCPLFDSGLVSGGGFVNNVLAVTASGQVSVPGGQTLTVTGVSSSLGLLTLSGGTAHFTQLFTNANAINTGTIQGFGTLRFDAGLHNFKFGTLALAGASGVFGNITNDAGATIHLQGTQPNVFFNNIANNGSILIDAGASAIFYGNITGNAPASALSLAANASATLITPQSAIATANFSMSGSINNWNASLNLNGGALVVESPVASKPATLATLRNQVLFAMSNPAGISSSGLAANMAIAVIDNGALAVPFTTFFGQPADTNSLLVAPELLGDANADGHVDLTDLSTVLNNFGSTTSAWTSGNFDNAATIDLTDLSDVLNNFGAANPVSPTLAAAPEPSPLLLLAVALPALLYRPQKQKRTAHAVRSRT